ncbi:MAG TPA: hypothetical protein VLQ80_07145 [Candidatus Saccharimonadia bacterium]|nr:hypothetical protein [Candidatus Saccharimonadia bacterium]
MPTPAATVPSLPPPASPLSLDEFAARCLDTVVARARGDAQRREAGKAHRARYAATRDTREPQAPGTKKEPQRARPV